MAKGNDKVRKMLDRYASPEAAVEALSHARDKIAKGQLREPLAADATPEQIAEYRQANGIPETPDKYELKLGDGLVIGEADKPLVSGFLETAHKANLPPDAVNTAINWYYAEQQRQGEAQFARDGEGKAAVVADLQAEYGPDFKRYIRAADELFAEAGEEFRDSIMQARMPDGTLVGANPKAVRWFVNRALTENPFATVVPAAGGTSQASAETELATLIKEAGDRKGAYWANDATGIAKRARHLELNKMFEKIPKK